MSDQTPSMCDVLKGNTSTIIKKLESQIPTNLQIYSDIYKEYLHMIDDIFGTCYLAEKTFFDRIVPDSNSRKIIDIYGKYLTDLSVMQIENYSNFLKTYSQMRISAMKNFDNLSHQWMKPYSMFLENIFKHLENK